MKPILFLDFDGIINSENVNDEFIELYLYGSDIGNGYCPQLVEQLAEFIKQNDFNIVVSSTWRKSFSVFELRHILSVFGIDSTRLLDITPDTGYERHKDISLWLEVNSESNEIQYPYYFVIDDDSDACTDEKNFYQVDVKTGFTEYHRRQANDQISELRLNSNKFLDTTYTTNSVYELLELQKKLFAQGYMWKDKGHCYKNVNYVKLHTSEMGYIYWDEDSAEKVCNIKRPQLEYDISEFSGEFNEN